MNAMQIGSLHVSNIGEEVEPDYPDESQVKLLVSYGNGNYTGKFVGETHYSELVIEDDEIEFEVE